MLATNAISIRVLNERMLRSNDVDTTIERRLSFVSRHSGERVECFGRRSQ